jgi:selenocysteine lyase/cysteine desulfurase
MGASVDFMLSLGTSVIEERVMELTRECALVLARAGAKIAYSNTPIIAARFAGHDAPRLSAALKERRILTAARHGNLRVSVHFYNDESDIAALAQALRAIG